MPFSGTWNEYMNSQPRLTDHLSSLRDDIGVFGSQVSREENIDLEVYFNEKELSSDATWLLLPIEEEIFCDSFCLFDNEWMASWPLAMASSHSCFSFSDGCTINTEKEASFVDVEGTSRKDLRHDMTVTDLESLDVNDAIVINSPLSSSNSGWSSYGLSCESPSTPLSTKCDFISSQVSREENIDLDINFNEIKLSSDATWLLSPIEEEVFCDSFDLLDDEWVTSLPLSSSESGWSSYGLSCESPSTPLSTKCDFLSSQVSREENIDLDIYFNEIELSFDATWLLSPIEEEVLCDSFNLLDNEWMVSWPLAMASSHSCFNFSDGCTNNTEKEASFIDVEGTLGKDLRHDMTVADLESLDVNDANVINSPLSSSESGWSSYGLSCESPSTPLSTKRDFLSSQVSREENIDLDIYFNEIELSSDVTWLLSPIEEEVFCDSFDLLEEEWVTSLPLSSSESGWSSYGLSCQSPSTPLSTRCDFLSSQVSIEENIDLDIYFNEIELSSDTTWLLSPIEEEVFCDSYNLLDNEWMVSLPLSSSKSGWSSYGFSCESPSTPLSVKCDFLSSQVSREENIDLDIYFNEIELSSDATWLLSPIEEEVLCDSFNLLDNEWMVSWPLAMTSLHSCFNFSDGCTINTEKEASFVDVEGTLGKDLRHDMTIADLESLDVNDANVINSPLSTSESGWSSYGLSCESPYTPLSTKCDFISSQVSREENIDLDIYFNEIKLSSDATWLLSPIEEEVFCDSFDLLDDEWVTSLPLSFSESGWSSYGLSCESPSTPLSTKCDFLSSQVSREENIDLDIYFNEIELSSDATWLLSPIEEEVFCDSFNLLDNEWMVSWPLAMASSHSCFNFSDGCTNNTEKEASFIDVERTLGKDLRHDMTVADLESLDVNDANVINSPLSSSESGWSSYGLSCESPSTPLSTKCDFLSSQVSKEENIDLDIYFNEIELSSDTTWLLSPIEEEVFCDSFDLLEEEWVTSLPLSSSESGWSSYGLSCQSPSTPLSTKCDFLSSQVSIEENIDLGIYFNEIELSSDTTWLLSPIEEEVFCDSFNLLDNEWMVSLPLSSSKSGWSSYGFSCESPSTPLSAKCDFLSSQVSREENIDLDIYFNEIELSSDATWLLSPIEEEVLCDSFNLLDNEWMVSWPLAMASSPSCFNFSDGCTINTEKEASFVDVEGTIGKDLRHDMTVVDIESLDVNDANVINSPLSSSESGWSSYGLSCESPSTPLSTKCDFLSSQVSREENIDLDIYFNEIELSSDATWLLSPIEEEVFCDSFDLLDDEWVTSLPLSSSDSGWSSYGLSCQSPSTPLSTKCDFLSSQVSREENIDLDIYFNEIELSSDVTWLLSPIEEEVLCDSFNLLDNEWMASWPLAMASSHSCFSFFDGCTINTEKESSFINVEATSRKDLRHDMTAADLESLDVNDAIVINSPLSSSESGWSSYGFSCESPSTPLSTKCDFLSFQVSREENIDLDIYFNEIELSSDATWLLSPIEEEVFCDSFDLLDDEWVTSLPLSSSKSGWSSYGFSCESPSTPFSTKCDFLSSQVSKEENIDLDVYFNEIELSSDATWLLLPIEEKVLCDSFNLFDNEWMASWPLAMHSCFSFSDGCTINTEKEASFVDVEGTSREDLRHGMIAADLESLDVNDAIVINSPLSSSESGWSSYGFSCENPLTLFSSKCGSFVSQVSEEDNIDLDVYFNEKELSSNTTWLLLPIENEIFCESFNLFDNEELLVARGDFSLDEQLSIDILVGLKEFDGREVDESL